MSTISKIMGAIGRHGDDCIRDADAASESFEGLRELIAAALADALREGAEAMRARIFSGLRVHYGNATEMHLAVARELDSIRALPLPTGKRQAVLLTDAEVKQIGDATLYAGGIYDRVRAIETAVLAANNLEVRRG